MPSTYAHYLFGERVAEKLSGGLAQKVAENKQLYYIGLHGPDILFYYKPLSKNDVNSLGYAMHDQIASGFFKRAADMCRLTQNSDAAEAYLAGFVCHYALDKACHGYIEKKIEVSGLAHSEIENEFDRFLIDYSGGNLKSLDITAHITASAENAQIIAPFFENVTAKQVKKALNSMKFYNNMLICNRWYKRALVTSCLKISGKYKKMSSAILKKHPIEACDDSNKRLFKLFNRAIGECVELQNSFAGCLKGENQLDENFGFTFGAGETWRDIPVLTAAEEDKFEV